MPNKRGGEQRAMASGQPHRVLEPMLTRRSVSTLSDHAPSDDEIDALLQAAVTVPDHGRLRPWRLVVIKGDARHAFGDALAAAGEEAEPDQRREVIERLRAKAFVAPALIAVVARVDPDAKVAAWEQVASASCAGYAIALAAHQLGLGAMWKSSPFREGEALQRVLDMAPPDHFLGWVNVGRLPAPQPATARAPVDLSRVVRVLSADGSPEQYHASAVGIATSSL